jgi:hypothetical protein
MGRRFKKTGLFLSGVAIAASTFFGNVIHKQNVVAKQNAVKSQLDLIRHHQKVIGESDVNNLGIVVKNQTGLAKSSNDLRFVNRKKIKVAVNYNLSSVLLKDLPRSKIINVTIFSSELNRFNSPLSANEKRQVYSYCLSKGIDPAYLLALSRVESHHGTASSRIIENNNPGNIRAKKGEKSDSKGFKIFKSPKEGMFAMVDLISSNAYVGSGRHTVQGIAKKYAPSNENNTNHHVNLINSIRSNLVSKIKKD